jgi:CPA1 family monovalent cation:H+ antiporter
VSDLEVLFVVLLAAAVLVRVADLIRVPYPIVLVLGGLAIGVIPGLPDVRLEPDVVFLVFLPPLLTAAGYYASPQELRAESAAIGYLAVGLVLLTVCAVAVVAHAVIEGLPWAAAFVLGAVVAPTDPLAASATFKRLGAPHRVRLVVEGEAMLNDATGLSVFRVARAAALGGTFDFFDAGGELLVTATGGIAVGLVAAWVQLRILERLDDPPLAILWTILSAYGSYIAAEGLGVSGVLAAVVSGLYLGWHAHSAFDADTRLSAVAFWEVLEFLLNALIFILLGLQFPMLEDELPAGVSLASAAGAGLAVAGTVIVVRIAAQFVPFVQTGETWRERLVVGWSGMRGAISLAAALSVPLTIEGRPQIVVATYVVILVTLVGQGLTLPLLLRALGLQGHRQWSFEEAMARLEAAQSALDRLEELEEEGAPPEAVRRLRELYRARFRMCQAVLGGDPDAAAPDHDERMSYAALRRELITAERAALVELRNGGRIPPAVMRQIQRDLDLEEARIRAA